MKTENKVHVNKVKNRMLFLSPTVKEGLEAECKKEDFVSEGDKAVGKGGFGQVWKVRHKETNKIYAIKVISKSTIIEANMTQQMNREIEIMYMLHHPYIIKLVNHYEDDDNIYLIMNFASKGQLYSHLKRQGKFDQRTAAQYLREVISALKYLHSFNPPIIHRDIKPENILVDENGRLKLCDFGWSNYEEKNKRTTYCGTPDYLAPEMIKKEGHDTRVDIWYLGVLMFELLAGRPPFAGTNQDELFNNIKKIKINWPDDISSLAKNLISKILKQNPKERLSLDEILGHTWFEKNPAIRPLLSTSHEEQKMIIESFLVHKRSDMNTTLNSSISLESANGGPNGIAIDLNEKKSSVSRLSSLKILLNSNSDEVLMSKNLIDELKQSNEKYMKESLEFKVKFEKSETELKYHKNELIKMTSSKTQLENENQKLREELDRYKTVNKDRLILLTEIEEKNSELIEFKNKAKYFENEIETMKRNLKLCGEKLSETQKNCEFLENKNLELKKEIDTINMEKESISMNYQQKIKVLEAKIFEPSSFDESGCMEKLLEMINESLIELKPFLKQRTDNLEKILYLLKDECNVNEKKFVDLVDERHSSIIEFLSKLKGTFEENFNKIKEKVDKDNNTQIKANERLDWMKKQITELIPFKTKTTTLENQLQKVDSQIKTYQELAETCKTSLMLSEKLNVEQRDKIKVLSKTIVNLEAKLSDCKDFVFKFCADKLDDFHKCYRF